MSAPSRRWTLVAATIASGITSLPTTALGVALPTLHREFHASVGELQWTLTAYSIAYAALLVVAGRLGDIFGHRRLFVLGAAVFGTGSVAAALADSPVWLIASLAAIGIGGSMLVPASLSVVTNAFSGPGRTRGIALWGGASGLISGLGPPVGGLLTDALSWRWIFWVEAAVVGAALLLALARIRESRDSAADRSIDAAGVLALTGTISLFSLPLIQAFEWGWASPVALASFGAAGAFLVAFLLFERRAESPIFELGLFRYRNFSAGVALKFAINFALASLFFLLPLHMQEILGYSPTESGLLLLPLSATFLAGLPLGGFLLDRVGPRPPMLGGLVLMVGGIALLSDLSTTSEHYLWPALLVLGLGLGVVLTPINAVAVDAVPSTRHGEATGILTTTLALGSVLGIALCGALFKELEDGKLHHRIGTGVEVHRLEGVLVHAPPAESYLRTFPPSDRHAVVDAVRGSFTYGIENAVRLSAVVVGVSLVLTALLVRRARPAGRAVPAPATGASGSRT